MKSELRRRLIERNNIHFDHIVGKHKWPAEHTDTFTHVTTVGKTDYEKYFESLTIETQNRPWRAQTKRRAQLIAALARQCLDDCQSEMTWRLKVESKIFERFTIEVACRKCSGRLWRSELEVTLNSLDAFGESLHLHERQERREQCSCSETNRKEDPFEPGLNKLFHDRADELIKYQGQDPLADEKEKPDRICGLRNTGKFEQVLNSAEDKRPEFRGQLLWESIEHSPYKGDGESALFPFLVLEAKAEKGNCGFGNIQTQTAFAIQKLLKVQHDLKTATGSESQWGSGPLVWFLAYCGEKWRVAAAYVQAEGNVPHYRVVDLWDGRIDHPEGALQLLLIIDYIFDWARDCYREAVFCELRTLAARNLSSLADESEVLSLADPSHRFWASNAQGPLMDDANDSQNTSNRPFDELRRFDSPHGVIRNANIVRARFLALYITRDNIDSVLRSLDTEEKAQRTARDLLRLLRESWRVMSDTLDGLEYMWTGQQQESSDLYGVEQKFCAVFNVAAYISPSWEQVLELSFVAIAEDALPDLKERAGSIRGTSVFPSELPFVSQKHLTGYLRFARQGSIRSTLQAAIARSCLSSRLARQKNNADAFFLVSEEVVEKGIRYRQDVTMLPSREAKAREMVVFFYNRYKIGMREPKESFLRLSETYESRSVDFLGTESIWPQKGPRINEGDKAVLVLSKQPSSWQHTGRLCLYVIDGFVDPHLSPLDQTPGEMPYLARRQDTKPGWGSNWNDEFTRAQKSDFSIEMHKFEEYYSSVAKLRTSASPVEDNTTARGTGSGYHKSNELPLHFRKKPVGHFVTGVVSSTPYLDMRTMVDFLVARKQNVKLVTCLYAQSDVPGRQGLMTETAPPTTPPQQPSKEDVKNVNASNFKITNIMQAGDEFTLPHSLRDRREQSSEPIEKVGYAGDWLTDDELDEWLMQGKFGNTEITNSSKRHYPATLSDDSGVEPANKRPRIMQEVTPGSPLQSRESEHLRVVGWVPPPGRFPRDHMADDELEAFLQADHFLDDAKQGGITQEAQTEWAS